MRVVVDWGTAFALFASAVVGQMHMVPSPCGQGVYDPARDRVVVADYYGPTATIATLWFDGATFVQLPAQTFFWYTRLAAYDAARGVIVSPQTFSNTTHEWDGSGWSVRGAAPYQSGSVIPNQHTFYRLSPTYHPGRRRIVATRPGTTGPGIDLVEWDGATWSLILTTNAPATAPSAFGWYFYGPMAYDVRRGKLVLHGRTQMTTALTSPSYAPHAWEWDEASGWTQTVTGAVVPTSGPDESLWFDEQRGRILKYARTTTASWNVSSRRDDGSWAPIGTPSSVNAMVYCYPSSYDPVRQRVYGSSATASEYLTDLYPAEYVRHGTGCASPLAPRLELVAPWTRAWRGQDLSVTVNPAPQSFAVLATGFSDQAYGTVTLPMALASAGMPGCELRVAPEHLQLGFGASGTVRFDLPVPDLPALVGVEFWQQAFTIAIGSNPAGVLLSDSKRGRIGKAD